MSDNLLDDYSNFVSSIVDIEQTMEKQTASLSKACDAFASLSEAMSKTNASFKAADTAASIFRGSVTGATQDMGVAGKAAEGFSRVAGSLKGGLIELGTALVGLAVSAIVDYFAKLEKKKQDLTAITKDLSEVIKGTSTILVEEENGAVRAMAGISALSISTEELITKQAELTEKTKETFITVAADAGLVDGFVATIKNLATGSKLGADQQRELKYAVEGVNEICGTNIQILDMENGKLSESVESIEANTAAWQRNARAQAAKEAMIEAERNYYTAQAKTLAVKKEIADLEAQRDESYYDENLTAGFNAAIVKKEEELKNLQTTEEGAKNTAAAMKEVLYLEQEAFEKSTDGILSYINTIPGLSGALQGAGVDTGAFSQSLADIGLSTSDLAEMGPEGIQRFAEAWNNNGQQMTDDVKALALQLGLVPDDIAEAFTLGVPEVTQAMNGLKQLGIEDPLTKIPELMSLPVEEGIEAMNGVMEEKRQEIIDAVSSGDVSAVQEALSGLPEEFLTKAAEGNDAFAQAIRDGQSIVKGAMDETGGIVQGSLSDTSSMVEIDGIQVPTGFANAMNSNNQAVRDAAWAIYNETKTTGKGKDESWQWGVDLVKNLIEGMFHKKNELSGAAGKVAGAVAEYLKHSVPKKGPLHEGGEGEKRWGRHLVQNIAEGMDSSLGYLLAAGDRASRAVQDAFEPTLQVESSMSDFEQLGSQNLALSYGSYDGEPVAIYNVYLNDWKLNDVDEMRDVTIGTLVELVRKGQM